MDDHVSQGEAVEDRVDGAGADRAGVTMAGTFRIPDVMWERIAPLIPPPEKTHPFGGGRPRVPDCVVLDGAFLTGCQWRVVDATDIYAPRRRTGAMRSDSTRGSSPRLRRDLGERVRRWVGERVHSWINGYRALPIRW